MNRAEFIARAVLATIGTGREQHASGTAEVLWTEYQKALVATGGIPAEVPPPAPRERIKRGVRPGPVYCDGCGLLCGHCICHQHPAAAE